MKKTARKIKAEVNKDNIKANYREARGILTQLKHISKEVRDKSTAQHKAVVTPLLQ